MDDFNVNTLRQCTNELCSRLINMMTPLLNEGIKSIFEEAWKTCKESKEESKYLMSFQNLLCRIPRWNSVIIEQETRRIVEKSGCDYLEDLITCVHIIHLKTLTAIRVGNKQKKIDISIPKLDDFIHKVYINIARKLYVNIYLFERNITPLQMQKNLREFEIIINECILNAIRDSIPTEQIIRAYMDETGTEIEEEVIIEDIPVDAIDNNALEKSNITLANKAAGATVEPVSGATEKMRSIDDIPADKSKVPFIESKDNDPVVTTLKFNDIDSVLNEDNTTTRVTAPKDIQRLEEISTANFMQRKLEEEEDENEKISVLGDVSDADLGIDVIGGSMDDNLLDDVITVL